MTIEWQNAATIIWDLDGTLVDSAADIATAVNLVLADANLPALPEAEIRQMVGNGAGKLLDRAFAAVDGLDSYDSEAAYQRFLFHYKLHCCEKTGLFPGIAEVVQQCSAQGMQQGICTNKPVEMAELILTHFNLLGYFGSVIGGDSTDFRKPHAQPLLVCMQELNANPATTIMIGDSAADVGVARAAEVPVAVFPWGYSKTDAASLGADDVLASATDLIQKLTV